MGNVRLLLLPMARNDRVRAFAATERLRWGLVGIEPGDTSAFATLDRTDDEVLLGTDDKHLDFRGSVLVEERVVTLSTLVRINNRRGRLYMTVVWPLHALVVRSMLRRAQYSLADGVAPGQLAPRDRVGVPR